VADHARPKNFRASRSAGLVWTTNAFIRDDARLFRTSFINGRGDEQMGNA